MKKMHKGKRTRELIIEAAIKVIAEVGRDKASILEITKVANVGNGTFYYHFKNKDEILAAIGETVTKNMVDSYDIDWESAKEDPAILIAKSTKGMLLKCSEDPVWAEVIIDALSLRDDTPVFLRGHNKNLIPHLEYGISKNRFDTKLSEDLLCLIQSINRTALIMILEGKNKKQSIIRAIEAKLRILGVQTAEARRIANTV